MGADAQKFTSKVSDLLKQERLAKGLSHQRLSDLSGVHRSTISRLESKSISPTLYVFKRLADALGIELSLLLKRAERALR